MSRGPLASAGVAISVVTVAALVLAGCGRPGNSTTGRRASPSGEARSCSQDEMGRTLCSQGLTGNEPSITEASPANTKADAEYEAGRYEYGERYGTSADYRKRLAECLHEFQRFGFLAYKLCVKY